MRYGRYLVTHTGEMCLEPHFLAGGNILYTDHDGGSESGNIMYTDHIAHSKGGKMLYRASIDSVQLHSKDGDYLPVQPKRCLNLEC